MNKRVKSWLLSAFLLVLISLFIFFNLIDFVIGPQSADQIARENTIRLYNQANEDQVDEYLNRFSLEEVYTIVKIDDAIKVLRADGTVAYSRAFVELPSELTQEAYYGYYNRQLVFVEKEGLNERFYNIETLEVVFEWEGH